MLYSERKSGKRVKGDFEVFKKLSKRIFNDFLLAVSKYDIYRNPIHKYSFKKMQHYFLLKTKREHMSPLSFESAVNRREELFDMLETGYMFLDENASSAISFDYETSLNEILIDWGFKMQSGLILDIPEEGMQNLVDESVPTTSIPSSEQKIQHAYELFFRHDAKLEDKKSAAKVLGELLEHVRSDLKVDEELSKDESDLFHILNKYGVRHHKESQKEIKEPYLTWHFYSLLNTVKTYLKIKK